MIEPSYDLPAGQPRRHTVDLDQDLLTAALELAELERAGAKPLAPIAKSRDRPTDLPDIARSDPAAG